MDAVDLSELVRHDLLQRIAPIRRVACLSRVLRTAATPEEWLAVAADLDIVTAGGASWQPAARAAEAMARGDAALAARELADQCGLSMETWCAAKREERAQEGGA